jgi:hypothetical protein
MRRIASTSLRRFFSSLEEKGFLGVIYLELIERAAYTLLKSSNNVDFFSVCVYLWLGSS